MEWAKLEAHGYTFLLRSGNGNGEPRLVVEPLNEDMTPARINMYQTFANSNHPSLLGTYIPHMPLAVGRIMAELFEGKVVEFSKPQGTPEPLPPGRCY